MGYILHLSDFHFTSNFDNEVKILDSMAEFLNRKKCVIDYLVFTGDLVDGLYLSSCAVEAVIFETQFFKSRPQAKGQLWDSIKQFNKLEKAKDRNKNTPVSILLKAIESLSVSEQMSIKEYYDDALIKISKDKLQKVAECFKQLCWKLNIGKNSLILCCGNHDILRFLSSKYSETTVRCPHESTSQPIVDGIPSPFSAYDAFYKDLEIDYGREPQILKRHNANFLVLNTNYNPGKNCSTKSGACIDCNRMKKIIRDLKEINRDLVEETGEKHTPCFGVTHKPLNEYCEYFRMPFPENNYSDLGEQLYSEELYWLVGDKHTSTNNLHTKEEISGVPLSGSDSDSVITYTLLSDWDKKTPHSMLLKIAIPRVGEVRADQWYFEMKEELEKSRNLSQTHLTDSSRQFWGFVDGTSYKDNGKLETIGIKLTNFYRTIIRYREDGKPEEEVEFHEGENVFQKIVERINADKNRLDRQNPLNIRGQIGSGKSTFMGLLYQYLQKAYQERKFDWLPAYYNVRNGSFTRTNSENVATILNCIECNFYNEDTEEDAEIGKLSFLSLHRRISSKGLPVCYLVDGLDEVDRIGAVGDKYLAHDIVSKLKEATKDGSKFIIAWNQYNGIGTKNTDWEETSDVLFVNEVDTFKASRSATLEEFVREYYKLAVSPHGESEVAVKEVCKNIRALELPKINLHYLHEYYHFLRENPGRMPESASAKSMFQKLYSLLQNDKYIKEWTKAGTIKVIQKACYLIEYENCTFADLVKYSDAKISFNDFQTLRVNKALRIYLFAQYYQQEYDKDCNISSIPVLQAFVPRTLALFLRTLFTSQRELIHRSDNLYKEYDEHTKNNAHQNRTDVGRTESPIWACAAITAYFAGCCEGSYEERIKVLKPISQLHGIDLFRSMDFKRVSDILEERIRDWKGNPSHLNFSRLSSLRSLFIAKIALADHVPDSLDAKMESECTFKYLLKLFFKNSDFREFNRVIQRAYYGDIETWELQNSDWEDKPNRDNFDFVYTYGVLSRRLNRIINDTAVNKWSYLNIVDLLTICDLAESRLKDCGSYFNYVKPGRFNREERIIKRKERINKTLQELRDLINTFQKTYRNKYSFKSERLTLLQIDSYLKYIKNLIAKHLESEIL